MRWVLYGFGMVYIAFGTAAILYAESCRRLARRIWTEGNARVLAAAAGVGGLLLILASGHSRQAWFVVLLGVLALGKCLLFLAGPAALRDGLARRFIDAPDQTWRLYGIVGLVLGTAIVSWVLG